MQKGDTKVKCTYNPIGLRIAKTINGVKTEYTLDGSTIVAETTKGKTIWYDYDTSGMPLGFTVDDTSYCFKKSYLK